VALAGVIAAVVLLLPRDPVALAAPIYLVLPVLIVGVFVALWLFGQGTEEAQDTLINLAGFQPLELVKLAFVLFLGLFLGRRAAKLRYQRDRIFGLGFPRQRHILPAIAVFFALFLSFVMVNDLGPLLILSLVFLALFYVVTRASGWVVAALLVVALLVAVAVHVPAISGSQKVALRMQMWLDPWENAQPNGDQGALSRWAIAAGYVKGRGLGYAPAYGLPAGHTDLVQAHLAEELGAFGMLLYIFCIGVIAWQGFVVATQGRTPERTVTAAGLSTLLVAQWVVIFCGTTGMLPLTGVPVPFLSYGKTHMITFVLVAAMLARLAEDGRAREVTGELLEIRRGSLGVLAGVLLVLAGGAAVAIGRAWCWPRRTSLRGGITTLAPEPGYPTGRVSERYDPRFEEIARRIPRGPHPRPRRSRDRRPRTRRASARTRWATPWARCWARPSRSSCARRGCWSGCSRTRSAATRSARTATRSGWPRCRRAASGSSSSCTARRRSRRTGRGPRPWPRARRAPAAAAVAGLPSAASLAARGTGRARVAAGPHHRRRRVPHRADHHRRSAAEGHLRHPQARRHARPGRLRRGHRRQHGRGARARPVARLRPRRPLAARAAARPAVLHARPEIHRLLRRVADKTGFRGVYQGGSAAKIFTGVVAARAGVLGPPGTMCPVKAGPSFPCVHRDAEGPFFTKPGWYKPVHDHPLDCPSRQPRLSSRGWPRAATSISDSSACSSGAEAFSKLVDDGLEMGFGSGLVQPGQAGSRDLALTAFGQHASMMNVSQAARLVALVGGGGRVPRCPASLEKGVPCDEKPLLPEARDDRADPGRHAAVMTRGHRARAHTRPGLPAGLRRLGKTGTADSIGIKEELPWHVELGVYGKPHSWFLALAEPAAEPECKPLGEAPPRRRAGHPARRSGRAQRGPRRGRGHQRDVQAGAVREAGGPGEGGPGRGSRAPGGGRRHPGRSPAGGTGRAAGLARAGIRIARAGIRLAYAGIGFARTGVRSRPPSPKAAASARPAPASPTTTPASATPRARIAQARAAIGHAATGNARAAPHARTRTRSAPAGTGGEPFATASSIRGDSRSAIPARSAAPRTHPRSPASASGATP
jgi:cell division protein FtsW (lipid II flippase)